jgi:hypothetical protein
MLVLIRSLENPGKFNDSYIIFFSRVHNTLTYPKNFSITTLMRNPFTNSTFPVFPPSVKYSSYTNTPLTPTPFQQALSATSWPEWDFTRIFLPAILLNPHFSAESSFDRFKISGDRYRWHYGHNSTLHRARVGISIVVFPATPLLHLETSFHQPSLRT